jgi:protein NrfD
MTATRIPASQTPPPEVSGGAALPAAVRRFQTYRGETYYDIAPLRHSHYKWPTGAAFFCSGIAGAAQIIAVVADLSGNGTDRRLVRTGRYLALSATALSTGLLISELHFKQRWYNMLRLFKKTSPMSIGIWALTPFGILNGMTAGAQLLEDFGHPKAGRLVGRIVSLPAAALGSLVATYMGTEQEETSMPLWASAYPLMAPFYAAAGFSNAAAALSLIAPKNGSGDPLYKFLDQLALVSGAAEVLCVNLLRNRWKGRPEARAFERSALSTTLNIGAVHLGMIVPLALRSMKHAIADEAFKDDRWAAIFKLAGGLLTQIIMIYAGAESGRHARDYFEYTRAAKAQPPVAPIEAKRAPLPDRKTPTEYSPKRRNDSDRLFGWGLVAAGVALFTWHVLSEKRSAHGDP